MPLSCVSLNEGSTARASQPRGSCLGTRAHLCRPVSVPSPTLGLPASGDQKSAASQKPRSRGLLHSLFCCVCRDDGEALPAHSGAPLLVEENGAVPKVCDGQEGAAGAPGLSPQGV